MVELFLLPFCSTDSIRLGSGLGSLLCGRRTVAYIYLRLHIEIRAEVILWLCGFPMMEEKHTSSVFSMNENPDTDFPQSGVSAPVEFCGTNTGNRITHTLAAGLRGIIVNGSRNNFTILSSQYKPCNHSNIPTMQYIKVGAVGTVVQGLDDLPLL